MNFKQNAPSTLKKTLTEGYRGVSTAHVYHNCSCVFLVLRYSMLMCIMLCKIIREVIVLIRQQIKLWISILYVNKNTPKQHGN